LKPLVETLYCCDLVETFHDLSTDTEFSLSFTKFNCLVIFYIS